MNIISKIFRILTLTVFLQQTAFSQTCPSVNAQAGTGASTTICSGQCANLTASVVPVNSTTTYTVGSTPYSPFPFSGGTDAISNVADDLWSTPINIGFNFCYFGNTFNQLLVGANGEITFSVTTAALETWTISSVLPNLIDHPGNTICGPYRDINPSDVSSSVRYYITGTAPCRSFVVYWDDAPLVSCITPKSTFQIVLHENTNIIDVFIENSTACAAWQGGKGLIGIQNAAGTTAVAPAGRNVLTAWTAVNEAWRFTPTGVPNYTVNWAGPGGFTATGLTSAPCPTATSNYTATMNVANCGGGSSSYTSAVQVSVTPTPTISPVASPTAICIGNSSTLTASGASSYTWNPGAITGSSLVVTPTTTTIYTVTGVNGSCISTQTISLTVNGNPTVTATRSPSLICGTGSSTLTGSGAFTYTWNPGALTGTSVAVTPTATTIYTVIGTSTLGCTGTRTLNVNVSPSPTITASASSTLVCSNSTVSLTGSGGTGNSYTWTPGPRTGSLVVVTPTANTTYTVTGRNAAGCIDTETISISVTSGITVTPVASPTVICSGSSSTLTVSGATTYTWNPGALTGATVVVTPTINTTYSVTGVDVSGCSNTKTITVAVRTPTINATKSPTIVCLGNSATITATGASTYTWNPGSITGNTIVVTPTATTIYTIVATNSLGCIGTRTVSMPVSSNPTVTAASTNTAICTGSSTTLTASGAISYTWMPGTLTGTAAVVNPTTNTTYTVTGRNVSGCISTGTIDITVNPSVTITPSASPTIICRGNSSTLTATGANSYTWNPGALTGSNVIVSPTITTTYSITGTATTGCIGTTTLSVNVSTISVNATSSPTILCSSASATLTGTGASTYTWEPGSLNGNTVVVTPTATTIYTLTGTNTVGCTATRTLNLVVGVTPTITASASSTLICAGTTVTLTTSGAVTYTWLPGAIVGATITRAPIINTTYTVNGKNASGCIGTNTVFVSVNPNPTITAVSNPTVICSGISSTLTANGALTYTWNPGGALTSSVIVTPTTTTAYTVIATSSLGCTGSSTVNLKVNPIPNITATSSSTAICSGLSATLTGNGAITYTWNPGTLIGSNVVVSPTTSTIYTVTGTNNGCSNSNTISITVNSNPTINAIGAPPNVCPGNTSTLSAIGAASYTWMPGSLIGTPVTVNPTVTTTYSVTGTDVNGCIDTETVTINTFPTPTITATSNPSVLCNGGSATLTATGGSSYDWEPGSLNGASVVVTPTSTTIYTVTGHTVPGCISTATVSLTVNPNPTVTASSNPTVICAGATATLTGVGATSYLWNPGALTGTTIAVTPTATTLYTVTGTTGSCSNTSTVSLTVNTNPTVTTISNPTILCSGNTATLTGSGATTYTWNPGALTGTTVAVTPTATTIYTVIGLTGSCSNTSTVSLTVNTNPTITATSNPTIMCSGATATLTANGATSYTWNPGALSGTTVAVTPTITTTYTVDGDNGSCVGTQTVTLVVNVNPTITATTSSNTICSGTTVTLTGSGAATYTWNPGALAGITVAVTPTITTTYTVDGDNGTGCVSSETVTVNVNTAPSVSIAATSTILCSAGSVTLTASGGTTYTWSPVTANTASIVDSPTITTTYTVDSNNGTGCIASQTITVNVGTTPTITATSSSNTICSGTTVTLTGSGAATYTWNPGALTGTTVAVTPTITTTYTVDGDNGTGCVSTETVIVNVNTAPSVSIAATSTLLCSTGSVTLTASGGTTYTWSPVAANTASIVDSPTITTTYTVDSDNGTGCIASQTITVNVGTTPTITATTSSNTICSGTTVTLTGSGAATYTWNPGALAGTTVAVTPTITTTYTVDGDNGTGCVSTETVTVNVNTTPSVSVAATSTILCSAGSITLTASGGTTYTWSPVAANTASIVDSPTITTTYTVDSDNGTGCIASQTITVSVGTTPTITATTSSNTICSGTTVTLTASGASTYLWDPLSISGSTITDIPTITTTYTVTGDDGTGCVSSETITVNVNTAPSVSVIATSTILCSAGSVTLTASGGTTYTWSPVAANTASIVDSPTITTTYTVDSDNGTGCIASQTITVNVSSNPTITISSSPIGTICVGTTATLTANGASTYTWNPGALSGTSITDTPTITTTYTVDGDNGFGCISTNTFVLDVAAGASITAAVNPTTVCANSTVSLSASGAITYTWMPLGTSGSSVIATPSISTTYTVLGDNGTCVASSTVFIDVTPGPDVTASASGSLACIGDVTLTSTSTSTNTLNYSWSGPSSFTATIQSPTTTIAGDYTVTVNDQLTGCSSTTTLTVSSNTVIPNLTATTSGSVECIGSVTITATSTSTNTLSYDWSGPSSFTAAVQSPTTSIAGDYSVTVSDATTGCSSSTTLTVGSNTVIPNLIATASGSLGCAGTVTITATSTSTNTLSYDWAGPLSFTASTQSPTTSVAGDYTVIVNDALTGCNGATSLTVGSSTIAPTYTATIIAATCSGTVANNDGTILLTGFGISDNYDLVQANTYTGTADYASATSIPTTGIITNSLVNPGITTPYTIRIFSANGCFRDTTLILTPTTCSITNVNVLGMTKAVSTATYVNNNAYNVTYTIVAINTSTVDLTNFSIIDNLNNTFPLPSTYGIISSPFITSLNSNLTINPIYNGSSQSNMIAPSSSTLAAGKRDTIVFTVQINPNGFFGPYNNSAVGFGTDNNSIVVSDSSNTGFNWDPDNDGNPTNNDTATVVLLNPNSSIGIAKSGSLSEVLDDKTIDITYIFNVKNLGNDTIKLVQVLDDLTIPSPAQFTIKSGPTASSGLTANSNYNGLSDNALLVTSKLIPGAIETITLVINVTPNEITSITNIAVVTGIGADGGIVRDTSNAGIEPDPNGNGDATEQGENNPTILELPNVELFIPEVFTPDGDGKNDFFVINGISGKTVKITVFNRWGNKVYENSAYDNTWNGIPNVSGVIGGNNKLPQGTYYYIAEFEDENDKPINGFVVLQY